ncbi:MAG: hypothetical protein KF716_25740 [Anaerolineae bacterium]|nr:hypothetical protein [Anaerolineae bacterium]
MTNANRSVGEDKFRQAFDGKGFQLLEPVDPMVNYSFEAGAVDPWTLELTASKWWLDEQDRPTGQQVTLATYDSEWPTSKDEATEDLDKLRQTYEKAGLESAMQQAEAMAVREGSIKVDRPDGRLFTEGPEDRFQTQRQLDLSQQVSPPDVEMDL